MQPDDKRLLDAVAARTQEVESALPPATGRGYGLAMGVRLDSIEHGPKSPVPEVFGRHPRGRQRGRRAMARLEAAGLVEVWRPAGVAVRVKLTPAGRALTLEAASDA